MKTTRKYLIPTPVHELTKGGNRSDFVNRAILEAVKDPQRLVGQISKRMESGTPGYVPVSVSVDIKAVEGLKSLSEKVDLSIDTLVRLSLEAKM